MNAARSAAASRRTFASGEPSASSTGPSSGTARPPSGAPALTGSAFPGWAEAEVATERLARAAKTTKNQAERTFVGRTPAGARSFRFGAAAADGAPPDASVDDPELCELTGVSAPSHVDVLDARGGGASLRPADDLLDRVFLALRDE